MVESITNFENDEAWKRDAGDGQAVGSCCVLRPYRQKSVAGGRAYLILYLPTMKTLVRVYQVIEADMIGMRLEAQGIPFLASDLYTNLTMPWLSGCVGGIDIQVNDEDYERARAALDDDGNGDTPHE